MARDDKKIVDDEILKSENFGIFICFEFFNAFTNLQVTFFLSFLSLLKINLLWKIELK